MEQEEIWRDIEGYERIYQVSNLGRVRSSDSYDRLGRLHLKGRILKLVINTYGYFRIKLCKEGKQKMSLVHRLVAQAFIPNPEGLPQINHKDEDKTNNVVFLKDDGSVDESRSNLEWCDCKYNNNYGTRNERAKKNMVQTRISNGTYDPEMCGIGDRKERDRLYYQKNKDRFRERRTEYMRKYRLKKKQEKKKDNHPSDVSLW